MQLACLVTYDADCRIRWASYFAPGYEGGPSSYPWDHAAEDDQAAVKAAAERCLHGREPTVCQAHWAKVGAWRVWFQPVDHTEARMVSSALPVPPSVQSLGQRELAVCQLVAAGLDICQIADALGLSVSSVKAAKRRAAEVANVPLHDLPVWVGEHRRFLEPL